MNGHSSSEESLQITKLENMLAAGSISASDKLRLALLCLEPGHEPDRAIEILEGFGENDSLYARAIIWLAHSLIYEMMDDTSIRKAIEVLGQVGEGEPVPVRAAAKMLTGAALEKLKEDSAAEQMLRESVALAPDWVTNRQLLAEALESTGNPVGARAELLKARSNAGEVPSPANLEDGLFELLITGRAAHGVTNRIDQRLKDLI